MFLMLNLKITKKDKEKSDWSAMVIGVCTE